MTRRVLVFAAALFAAPALEAQAVSADATAPTMALSIQDARPRKSPTLAGALSWFIFPGVGSYYAGNGSHGTRHLLIALPPLAAGLALLGTCDRDGFCDFDHDALRLSVTIALAVGYVVNAAWSVLTAISDAEQYNLASATSRATLSPAVRIGGSGVGVSLVRVAF
ncbi:MAG: hypothetical protein ACREN5_08675 [Gemmatimonadales bacterium]